VIEQISEASSPDDVIRHTAKRSVFAAEELTAMATASANPLRMIDFLLTGHVEPFVGLNILVEQGIFSGRPPQSISEISAKKYTLLRPHIRLGFPLCSGRQLRFLAFQALAKQP
jgi:hypothetical protein